MPLEEMGLKKPYGDGKRIPSHQITYTELAPGFAFALGLSELGSLLHNLWDWPGGNTFLRLKACLRRLQTFVGVTINIRCNEKKALKLMIFQKIYCGKKADFRGVSHSECRNSFLHKISKNQIKKLTPFFTRLLSASTRNIFLSKKVFLRKSLWIIATCRVPFLHKLLASHDLLR